MQRLLHSGGQPGLRAALRRRRRLHSAGRGREAVDAARPSGSGARAAARPLARLRTRRPRPSPRESRAQAGRPALPAARDGAPGLHAGRRRRVAPPHRLDLEAAHVARLARAGAGGRSRGGGGRRRDLAARAPARVRVLHGRAALGPRRRAPRAVQPDGARLAAAARRVDAARRRRRPVRRPRLDVRPHAAARDARRRAAACSRGVPLPRVQGPSPLALRRSARRRGRRGGALPPRHEHARLPRGG
mmetsp:Transcript_44417/g.147221  ORF Transcript_44417/g.147221 Transcript_44417/m.147221 type:complete len:246 (-) Transcript_44417:330-1067(-)